MRILSLDYETYSAADLAKCGLYRYVDDKSFEPLLLAYAYDDEPVQLIDFTKGEQIPDELLNDLYDEDVQKHAFNAAFERTVTARITGATCPPEQWRCTMIHASIAGLPRSLKDVGQALRLPEDQQKMKEGAALIQYFCKPCKPTKANGQRHRNLPVHDPAKWETFKAYCRQDVETERTIRQRLEAWPVADQLWSQWFLDQEINDRGVKVDTQMAMAAVRMNNELRDKLIDKAIRLTGMSNPNSVSQLKAYLQLDDGATLRKADLADLLGNGSLTDTQREVIRIRKELGKSSVSKYEAMLRAACRDDRVRGTMQYYKASRTGRWAGSLIQPQNFPQNHIDELDLAREMVKDGDAKGVELIFDSIPDTLSQLIRTCIIPEKGKVFAVADFSAIEARVVAWLAGEQWRMDVFRNGGDIYCASASQMFHVPVEKHGVNAHLRQKGKIAELALGYGGSVGAMIAMGADKMGIPESELKDIVVKWREASPKITKLWQRVQACAWNAMQCPGQTFGYRGLRFIRPKAGMLEIWLPSGRPLRYLRPKVCINKFGSESLSYEGNEAGKWGRCETFGGKLVENIVQAIARDCLAHVMMEVSKTLDIVFHVHDEMIVETDDGEAALKKMLEIMATPIPWADGLLLRGDGYVCRYYRKD